MQTHNSYSSPEKCNPIQPYSPENYQKEENYQEEPPPPFCCGSFPFFVYL